MGSRLRPEGMGLRGLELRAMASISKTCLGPAMQRLGLGANVLIWWPK